MSSEADHTVGLLRHWQISRRLLADVVLSMKCMQVMVRLGSPITGYGQESRNRAARQRISHRTYVDEEGVERVEVNSQAVFQSLFKVIMVCNAY